MEYLHINDLRRNRWAYALQAYHKPTLSLHAILGRFCASVWAQREIISFIAASMAIIQVIV